MSAPKSHESFEQYLATLLPMRAARVKATLETQVRVNGGEFMTRLALIEARIAKGGGVAFRGHERVLMTDGAWLDERNITRTGIDYAAWRTSEPHVCSICRDEHGLEILHECE